MTAAHIYQGHCPDELQPHARDANCPACRKMDRMISIDELRPLVAKLRTHDEINRNVLSDEPWLATAQADAKAVKRLRELVRESEK